MSSRPKYLRPGFLILWLILAAFAVVVGPRLVRLPGLLSGLKSDLAFYRSLQGGAKSALDGAKLDAATARLPQTANRVHRLRADWGPVLWAAKGLRWLPSVGGDLGAAGDLAEMGDSALAATVDLLPVLRPTLAALGSSGETDPLTSLAQACADNADALVRADTRLQQVQRARNRIDSQRLSARFRGWLDKADEILPLTTAAPDLLDVFPTLLGLNGARRYLILAQNSDELRATGGFISGAGLLTAKDGKIESLTFGDSYSVVNLKMPHAIPPAALETHMGAEILLFRDANWWIDFPSSARTAQELYAQDAGVQTDGVIAIDTQALQILLDMVGPIEIPEYKDTISSANLTKKLQEYWAAPASGPDAAVSDPEWFRHRKDFMGILAGTLVKSLLSPGDLDPMQLARGAGRLLQERHLLLYIPEAEAILASRRWDGALVDTSGDYLMVADSNVGFNKVNGIVRESIACTITLKADGAAEAELRIRYTHPSTAHLDQCVHEARYGNTYADMMDRCYWDYLRLLAPKGATLIERVGLEDGGLAESEAGRTVFDGLFVLSPGETREVVFRIALAASETPYILYVQKQSGTGANPLQVAIQPPSGEAQVWITDLSVDREFRLR